MDHINKLTQQNFNRFSMEYVEAINLFDTSTDYQEVEDNGCGCDHENVKVDSEGGMLCMDCGLTQPAY